MPWYFAESGQQVGPVEDQEFDAFVAEGRIKPEVLVWRQGMAHWQPFGTINGTVSAVLDGRTPTAQTVVRWCAECRRAYPIDDLAAFGAFFICYNCKPLFAQKLREGLPPAGTPPYAGFWMRFLAVLIDGLILSVVALFYTTPLAGVIVRGTFDQMRTLFLQLTLMGIGLLVGLCYETWFVGRFGATPGKMMCHLKVVRPDGAKLTYGRSLLRHLAKILNTFTASIGYLMALFDSERRALHDRLCDTRVMRDVPDPLQAAGGCPVCHSALPPETWNLSFETYCPSCRTPMTALTFPAQIQNKMPAAPEPVMEEGEATCFFHTRNKALVACDQCGRFLCSLCQMGISGQNWCPACIALHRSRGKLAYLDNRRMLYDNIALLLALAPIILLPVFWIAFITAPATLFVVFYYWRKLAVVVPRTKTRFVIAALLAGLELVGMVVIIVAVVVYMRAVNPR